MGPDYKITIHGPQSGASPEQVAQSLSPLLRHSPEQLLPALKARQAISLNVRGLPLTQARALKESIDEAGAASTLDSTAPLPAHAQLLPGEFDDLALRPFAQRDVGLTLEAPEGWRNESDDRYLRIHHTGTRTWFTASRTPDSGVGLAVWAEIRFGAMADNMPYLAPYRAPYCLDTAAGPAIVAEFRGIVPGDSEPTHQLVLCLNPGSDAVSLNIAATVPGFEQHAALYQWLLRTRLKLGATVAPPTHPEAQYDEGVRFAKAGNMAQAIVWFRQAADQRHAHSQYVLGNSYASGDGVAPNARIAFTYWTKAAEQGLAEAQYNLSAAYGQGIGTAIDPTKSFAWMLKAAEQGDPNAQFSIAVCYLKGNGVAKDDALAGEWMLKSAQGGNASAQFYAGCLYDQGQGLPLDPDQAVAWFRKAAAQGNEQAIQQLQDLGVDITGG